jgi:segregation and condensation protein B
MTEENDVPNEKLVSPASRLARMDLSLSAQIEGLLFVAPGPVTAAQLAAALDIPTPDAEKGLDDLSSEYLANQTNRGLRLERLHGRYQLTSAPETASAIERFLGLEITGRLSRASLEVLAIIAYKQPTTRPQIEAIRGVSSDAVVKSLVSKGLIMEVGRAEAVGRPILYSTTPEFLQYFGLGDVDDLPQMEHLVEKQA